MSIDTAGAATDTADETALEPLRGAIVEALCGVYDPEIPVNIYDLGLIYDLEIRAEGDVRIVMTLTTPHCPVAEAMPDQVQEAVEAVEGVRSARVDLVWEPSWNPSMMSESARMALDMW